MDAAFAAVTKDANWPQVARHLTTFGSGAGYSGFWLRRDKYDLELVVAYRWTGVLSKAVVSQAVDGLWVNTRALHGRLGHFSFSGSNLDKIVQTASALAPESWQAKLANLLVALKYATTPSVVLLAVGLGGLSPDSVSAAEAWAGNEFSRTDQFKGAVVNPSLRTGLVNALTMQAHGQTNLYSLSLPSLNSSLAFYQ